MLKCLFAPGLFTTPNSAKFAAFRDSLNGLCDIDIVDYSPLYKNMFVYEDFVDVFEQKMETVKPDIVLTYSFSSVLYQNIVQKNPTKEAAHSILVVPVGDYAASKNGHAILSGMTEAHQIYKPINELKVAYRVSPDFFAEIAKDGKRTADLQFRNNTFMISASCDDDVDPALFDHFKQQNAEGHFLFKDNHRMERHMNLVCSLLPSLIQK